MANPLIPLSVQNLDIGSAFSNALMNIQNIDQIRQSREERPLRRELLESQLGTAQTAQQQADLKLQQANQERFLRSAVLSATEINSRPDLQGKLQAAEAIKARMVGQSADPNLIQGLDEILEMGARGDAAGVDSLLTGIIQSGQQMGFLQDPGRGGAGGLPSAKTEILESGATIQTIPSTPGMPADVIVTNPLGQTVTGQERLDILEQARQQRRSRLQEQGEIQVETARKAEKVKLREKRASEITKELSQRNRDAARSSVRLNRALTAVSNATQGITGSIKVQLSKLLPNIDVSDEAILDQTLKQLAVDQLQAFKGPTTDFEFGVVQNTTGELGNSRYANEARLKSLKRAIWFNKREFEQFNRFMRLGGAPDNFAFNFNEQIETKKGAFSLQDIQDTAVQNNLTIEETIRRFNE